MREHAKMKPIKSLDFAGRTGKMTNRKISKETRRMIWPFLTRTVVCAAIIAFLPVAAAARSKAANYLVAEQIAGACGGKKGQIDSASVIERDLTGDGKADLIISDEGIRCADGTRSSGCGMQVCSVNIYVRRGELLILTLERLGARVRVEGGPVPTIYMYAHGGSLGSIRWDGSGFR